MANKTTQMESLIKRFRNKILDIAELNTLKGDKEFTDENIEGFIIEALYDINETEPSSRFVLQNFPRTGLLLDGAVIQMLKANGLLQLRNNITYSDAGLSVNLDDKSPYYAQWLSQLNQSYYQAKKEFKASLVPRFRGVYSPMSGRW